MRNLNKRKIVAIFMISAASGLMAVSFQNFTLSETKLSSRDKVPIGDSISAALASSEQENLASQVAANVEPGQVEKSHKPNRKIQTIEINSDFAVDEDTSGAGRLEEPDNEDAKVRPEDIVDATSPF